MTTFVVFSVISGIGAVVAVSVLGARLLVRRLNDWADRMIFSVFGSPQELFRRLNENQMRKAPEDMQEGPDDLRGVPVIGHRHCGLASQAQTHTADV
jgi:hypothetical protein